MGRWPERHYESWDLVFALWSQILHFKSQLGGQGLSALPVEDDLTSPGRLGSQGSTGRQGTENKGIQDHELAKTCHAMRFKKYILFLKSWQQFLQTSGSFRDLPFSLVFLLCFYWLIDWGGGYWARTCWMSKLLFGEASWLRYLFWSNTPFGSSQIELQGSVQGEWFQGKECHLEAESLAFSLALPFTTVIWGVTHLRSQRPETVILGPS